MITANSFLIHYFHQKVNITLLLKDDQPTTIHFRLKNSPQQTQCQVGLFTEMQLATLVTYRTTKKFQRKFLKFTFYWCSFK